MKEEYRQNIFLIMKLLNLEMKIEKDGVVTNWRWDYKNNKPIKIK